MYVECRCEVSSGPGGSTGSRGERSRSQQCGQAPGVTNAACSTGLSSVLKACYFLLLVALAGSAVADEPDALRVPAWKLTVGNYRYPDYSGWDVNLRWRRWDTDAWVGIYRDPDFGSQTRAGADTSVNLSSRLQLQPSLQVASGGFIGGSLTLQAGDDWYGFAGLGRTNLKPYFNLNFDPNDAITVGVGHKTASGGQFTAFLVADDRLHTQQKDWHLGYRLPVGDMRLTLDMMRKSGLSDAGPISAWGASATWDWPRWFVRIARDPYQNFSAQNAWRLATGVRF